MDPRFPTGKFTFDEAAAAEKRRDCIAAISSFPGELKASMAGARLDKTYRDGGWTARQVVHHVFRILRVTGHPVRQREDVAGMQIDQRSKRVAVAIAGLGDNRRVALVHPCCLDGLCGNRLALDGQDSGPLKGRFKAI